ncbi:CidA/LrgA family protein [Pseudaeromonas pectinilytica]|jgi:holin-like protein
MTNQQMLQRLIGYLGSFLIILACLAVGKWISSLLPFAFPGSILGMLILFILLNFQLVRMHWIEPSASLLLRHMALLFIPVAVGLLAYLDTVMASLGVIMLNVVLGISLILLVVGRLYQRMNR